ncbi:hypothetical protein TNCV_4086231 [Trichonephila clavipes]|nr:hypothetical protein TNCV_4086231 [Trichonephila clavipes]
MKDNDGIEPSSCPWAFPINLFNKDGSTRFCADYRRLNDVTMKYSYHQPRIDDTLDTLANTAWFSTLDLKREYWQVEIHPEDKKKTAFTTGKGMWQFKVMPFGWCNAPATFSGDFHAQPAWFILTTLASWDVLTISGLCYTSWRKLT